MLKPVEIKRIENSALSITWMDGSRSSIDSLRLRKHCPCAECRQARGEIDHDKPISAPKKSSLKVISASIEQETNLRSIWPVGNYALGIEWADGHNSGIYSYDYLLQLAAAGK